MDGSRLITPQMPPPLTSAAVTADHHPTADEMFAAAQWWVRTYGLKLFLTEINGKRPLRGSNGFKDATADLRALRDLLEGDCFAYNLATEAAPAPTREKNSQRRWSGLPAGPAILPVWRHGRCAGTRRLRRGPAACSTSGPSWPTRGTGRGPVMTWPRTRSWTCGWPSRWKRRPRSGSSSGTPCRLILPGPSALSGTCRRRPGRCSPCPTGPPWPCSPSRSPPAITPADYRATGRSWTGTRRRAERACWLRFRSGCAARKSRRWRSGLPARHPGGCPAR
jgi:hypothetical protein